ncbi:MAG: hypothetical protein J6M65_04380 [Eubacterium sp.]|nr:hypothetical protein [Eubacterium sp.]
MVEMHGWATIRDTYKVVDLDNTEKVSKILELEFKTINYLNPELKWINGECYLQLSLYSNHWSEECDEMLKIYRIIADKAEGSYGLLYVYNDEDREFNNEFIIYRLVRGRFEMFNDKLLSPYIPIIEDEEL